jgi:SAM-dependent methyltransferase
LDDDLSLWELQAAWWQQGFTGGVDAEYTEQILPLLEGYLSGATRLLDAGCGEGQCARHLAAGGGQVVGVDPTASHLVLAADRGGGPVYARATIERLPVRSAAFDAAMVVLVLEHVRDWRAALAEVVRALQPGGRLALLLNHPLLQTPGSGWIDDRILDEQYWRIGPYLTEDESLEEVDAGVTLPFFHRPVSTYLNECLHSGLRLERIDEPPPPPGFLARAEEYAEAASIPRLLGLLFRRE